jgi:hypothetical protein
MRKISATAPSRHGKKQVIAFLRPNQAEAAYSKAVLDDMTNQEIIGQAINAVFASKGEASPVEMGHRRIIRRGQARAGIRTDGKVPSCRNGRIAYGGWFDKDVVDKIHAFASTLGTSVQTIIEEGLYYVTGVEAAKDEDIAIDYFPKRQRKASAKALV